jgi:hypothetical protein
MAIHEALGRAASRAHATDDDLSELLTMDFQKSPERGVRRIGAAVPLAPGPVVPEEPQERRLIDVSPVPLRLEGRDRLGRARQQSAGIVADGVW